MVSTNSNAQGVLFDPDGIHKTTAAYKDLLDFVVRLQSCAVQRHVSTSAEAGPDLRRIGSRLAREVRSQTKRRRTVVRRCRLWVDAIEKVGCESRVRNNRIEGACYSNQRCEATGFLNQNCAETYSKSFFNSIGHGCRRDWLGITSSVLRIAADLLQRPSRRRPAEGDERNQPCRTVALGRHVGRCEDCAHTVISYNSCRNRHCPNDQLVVGRRLHRKVSKARW